MQDTNLAAMKVVVFQLKEKEYAIPIQQVRGIEKILHITRVPNTAHFVKGVINLRGVVTPIIDLRARFDIEESPLTDDSRIIIVHIDDLEVGLIVDIANDVIDIPSGNLEPQPEVVGTEEASFITAVAKIDKRLLILIDLKKVLSEEGLHETAGEE
ncbi:MAG: chemotaxis protein CheW [Bacillus sp. (in: firmicutes)]